MTRIRLEQQLRWGPRDKHRKRHQNLIVIDSLKTSWGRVGSQTYIQNQVAVEENFWDHFGVAKRKGLGTAGQEPF